MGFASTAEDLARFASWQFRVLGGGAHEVLKASTLREMHRVHFVDPDFETMWGLGFGVKRIEKTTLVGHGGSCPGFRTQLTLQPEERIAAVILTNASGVDASEWAEQVLAIVAPSLKAAVKEPGKGKTPDPALRKYAGTYSDAPWGGETFVLPWEEGLAMVSFPSDSDEDRSAEETAREHLPTDPEGRELGEEIVFESARTGRPRASAATAYRRAWSQPRDRALRPSA